MNYKNYMVVMSLAISVCSMHASENQKNTMFIVNGKTIFMMGKSNNNEFGVIHKNKVYKVENAFVPPQIRTIHPLLLQAAINNKHITLTHTQLSGGSNLEFRIKVHVNAH